MNKTPKQILQENGIKIETVFPPSLEKIIKSIEQFGKQEFKRAIELAAENAKTKKTGNSGSWYDASVDKESILKLIQNNP